MVLIALSSAYYFVIEWRLGIAMIAVSIVFYFVGAALPLWINVALFVLGWIFQFIGHKVYEHKNPAFFRNFVHLLIGPLWILNDVVPVVKSGARTARPEDEARILLVPLSPGTSVTENPAHGVLVVEDDPAIRRLVTMVLQRQGYRIETAVGRAGGRAQAGRLRVRRHRARPDDAEPRRLHLPQHTGREPARAPAQRDRHQRRVAHR